MDSLRSAVGADAVRTDDASLDKYGRDETEDLHFPPSVVVLPSSQREVAAVMGLASHEQVPVTPRGGGTGLSGGALPVRGGILLSLERLDRIRRIDPVDMIAEVEAGVVTAHLQEEVELQGLFYPPDPASRESCFIGGNIAEDSAGPRSCKYGTTRHFVLGLEAVLADGTPITTGAAVRKNAAGYDLTQLLVGSEGTLAVVTAAQLRLLALPKARLTLGLPFQRCDEAANSVAEIFRRGFQPAACEFMEQAAILAAAMKVDVPPQVRECEAFLLLEFDGDRPDLLIEQAAALDAITDQLGATETLVAETEVEQRRMWQIRSAAGEAVKGLSDYKEADTVVPRASIGALLQGAHEIADRHRIRAICYGHAGDGNLHVNLLRGGLELSDWQRRRDSAEDDLFALVVRMGGTVTGEHGIGWTQRRHLEKVRSPEEIHLMNSIKRAFDPTGILNPGKVIPDSY